MVKLQWQQISEAVSEIFFCAASLKRARRVDLKRVAQAHDQRNHEIDHLIRSIGHCEAGSLYKFGMPNHGNKNKSGLFINSYSIFMISATSILASLLLHCKPPLAPSKTAGLRNRNCKRVTLKSLNMMDQ